MMTGYANPQSDQDSDKGRTGLMGGVSWLG